MSAVRILPTPPARLRLAPALHELVVLSILPQKGAANDFCNDAMLHATLAQL